MMKSSRRSKPSAINILMSGLFAGGVLLGGSEFTGFPWGPLLGAGCWLVLGLMVLRLERKHG